MITFKELRYGFQWGAATVARLFAAKDRPGSVTMSLKTPKDDLQIYVTKTGKIRIHDQDGREWLPVKKKEDTQ